METITINLKEFKIIKLLGKGKGGYSYLVLDDSNNYFVIKQIHHEPCSYYTFGNKYKRPMDFLSELPKMWGRDDEHMGKHIGVFEDGKLCSVVGIYPLKTFIDGEEFLFATTGNVATLPEYEGRGYVGRAYGGKGNFRFRGSRMGTS